jgi:tetratricopeptide (TPR) repeat protein
VWNAANGEALLAPLFHPEEVEQANFSPDGQSLVTAGLNSSARVWRLGQQDPLFAVLSHSDRAISSAKFSRNGKFILTSSLDGTARVWAAATGEPVTVLLRQNQDIACAEFSPIRDDLFVTGSYDKTVCLWRLRKWEHPAATLSDLAELMGAQKLGFGGTLRQLKPIELEARFSALHTNHSELFETRPAEVWAWHSEMARKAQKSAQWQAAVWHLDQVLEARPSDAALFTRRGTAQAELGRWTPARKDFEAALELDRSEGSRWNELALVLMALNAPSEYRKLCAQAVQHAATQAVPIWRDAIVGICVLSTNGLQDYRPLLGWIREAADQRPSNDVYLRDSAVLLYRMGEFSQAAVDLEKFRRIGLAEQADLISATFLVLTELRLGQIDRAEAQWRDTSQHIDAWLNMKQTDPGGPSWDARVALNLWRSEVADLLPSQGK